MRKTPVNQFKDYSFISPAHIRAARGWLGWNLDIAAEKTGLSRYTIHRYEAETRPASVETLAILHRTFERAGVELQPDGIRARRS